MLIIGKKIILLCCIFLVVVECGDNILQDEQRFKEIFRWKQIGFDLLQPGSNSDLIAFPDQIQQQLMRSEQAAAESANYVAYNNVPMGVTHHKGRLYVTVPRRRPGIPATLNYILTKSSIGSSPSFRAYPNYQQNELEPEMLPDPDRIISVYRTRVDECNRLWFIDTGLLEYPNNRTQVQRPSIWIMDLETNRRLHRFEIPETIVQQGNGLASITVDVESDNCDAAFAYIPDLATYRLYTYDLEQDRIWSWSHNFFNFDPLRGDFNVGGQQFQWNDGIFSITLGNRNPDGFRAAYFHPMASIDEFSVSTSVLRNESLSTRSFHGNDFVNLGSRGAMTQSAMHDFHPGTKIIFYSQVGTNAVSCWNTQKPLRPENHAILQRHDTEMVYPSDLNVDRDGNIWFMTNTMPVFIYSMLDSNAFNFRIWRGKVSDVIRGTVCAI